MNMFYVAGIPYSDELYHHGIKGQKWGARRFQNKDGTLTEAGLARYRSGSEQKKFAKLATDRKLFKTAHNQANTDKIRHSPQVQHAANSLKAKAVEVNKLRTDYEKKEEAFYSDKKMYEKYLNKAVDNFMNSEYNDGSFDRKEVYNMYRYDDWDQGYGSSIDLYKNSSDGTALRKAEQKWFDSYHQLNEQSKTYADSFLGEYGNNKVDYFSSMGEYVRTARDRVSDIIADEAERKSYSFSDKMVKPRRSI